MTDSTTVERRHRRLSDGRESIDLGNLRLRQRSLLGLPLLPLAEDVAGRYKAFDVLTGEIPYDLAAFFAQRADVAIIVLDPATIERLGRTVGEAFAHELAHAIDHLDGRVRRGHHARSRRVSHRLELFANALGPLLLDHEPATLRAARPLIAAARRTQ